MRLLQFFCTLSLLSLPAYANAAKFLSDSLVNRLPCDGLSEANVLQHLQPNAFSIDKQLPVENWSSGGGLAECWSLSHTQRLAYFLGRFGQTEPSNPRDLEAVEDVIVGSDDFQVFPLRDISSLYNSLTNFTDSSGNERSFKSDIQRYEDWRFYQPSNADLILGERDRNPDDNAASFNQIQQDLSEGRMPLVILRGNLTTQHAVLIKRGHQMNGKQWIYDVYDSNFPKIEHHIIYDGNTQEFTAQDVVAAFNIDSTSPIGLFIEDESDMDSLQSTLFSYYQQRCQE